MVAIDLVREAYLGANETGALLWSAIAEGATRRRLVDLLMREYGIDSDRAGADVDGFVEALADRGLLEDGENP